MDSLLDYDLSQSGLLDSMETSDLTLMYFKNYDIIVAAGTLGSYVVVQVNIPFGDSNNNLTTYEKFPTVPDFGKFTSAKLEITSSISSSSTMYKYDISSVESDKIGEYMDLLVSEGFSNIGNFLDSKGNLVLNYTKDDIGVSIGLMGESFAVMVSSI